MRKATAALSVLFVLVFLCVAGVTAQATTGSPPGGAAGQPQMSAPAQTKTQMINLLKCSGNKKFTEAQLLEAAGIKVGDPMGQEIIRAAMGRIVDYYRKNGADLSLWVNIATNGEQANVEFLIDETGTKGHAGRYEAREAGKPGGPPLGTISAPASSSPKQQ